MNQKKKESRSLFSGTIDDVGSNLRRLKQMGVNPVIFGLMDPDLDRVIDTAKQATHQICQITPYTPAAILLLSADVDVDIMRLVR